MPAPAPKANNYHYNKDLKDRARALRNHSTKAEIYIWTDVLKGGYLKGYRFLRQRPILHYIADFACLELLLVIEIDGMTHEFDAVAARDRKKQRALEAIGFTVLRFSDWEVMERRDEVIADILAWIDRNTPVPEV